MSMLPIFLKLADRPCLLVGAGDVALDKIGSLLKTGLRLRVVAPEAHPEIRQLAIEEKLEWVQRTFELSDLDGNLLVIAATNVPAVNASVYQASVERGILCNSVDDIPNCDFFFGSVVSRGDLQIAISTAGESPAFAQRLRREIDEQLPEDLGPWLESLGALRREILETHPRGEERKSLLHQLAQRPICNSATCPSRQLVRTPHDINQHLATRAHKSTVSGHDFKACTERQSKCAENPLKSTRALAPEGTVYLVGAGPGDPELLTIKAMRLIQAAAVILHDDLVPRAILNLAAPTAEIVNVGKRCGTKTITQDEIHQLMIEHARGHRFRSDRIPAGRVIVRLKSGDPLIFGRAAEEMAALTEADVPFEVVPGITAAFAAAAAIGCSLTSREAASNVIFSTGHHAQSHNQSPLPEREDATRVVYMPGRDLHLLAEEWLQQGLPPDFPCAVVSRAAQPGQQVRYTTLGDLGDATPTLAPSLLIAGWAVREIPVTSQLATHRVPVTA